MGKRTSGSELQLLLVILLSLCGAKFVRARERNGNERSSQPRLNRIFSTSNAFGPLGGDREIDVSKQMLLLWSNPPADSATTTYDNFHYQIVKYDSSSGQFGSGGSLTGSEVTAGGTQFPAIGGNRHSVALAGDMIGDGYAEAVSVWETADQQVFASAQPINSSDLTFENSSVAGELVGKVTSAIDNFGGDIQACLSDMDGTGQEDLIIAWPDPTDNMVHIAVYGWSQTAASHLALISSIAAMPVPSLTGYTSLIALTAGDFRQNGHNEIALAGFSNSSHVYIKLFYLDNSNNLTGAGETVLPSYLTLETGIGAISTISGPVGSIYSLSLATGDLAGNSYNSGIALALVSSGPYLPLLSGNGLLYLAQPDTSLDSIYVSTDSSATIFATYDGLIAHQPATSMQCGDLNGTGTDQVVIASGNQVFVFQGQLKGQYLSPSQQSTANAYGPSLANDSLDFLNSTMTMRVGDVDGDQKDEIVVLRNLFIPDILPPFPNPSDLLEYFDITVLSTVNGSFTLDTRADLLSYQPDTVSIVNFVPRHYSLALGNFNGSGIYIGRPTHFYVPGVVQPLVILNAPPVQFDIFNGKPYDICNVFNGGSNAGNFATTYSQSTTNDTMMSTTMNTSWGVGASLSASASFLGAKVKSSLSAKYGQNFSKVQNSSYSSQVTVNVEAKQEDEIYADVTNYDLWEYPVLDNGLTKGHVLVTVPSPPQGEWFDTESWTANSFIPDHVVGNILSCLTYDSLNNPYMVQKIKGSLSDAFQLGTGNFSWNLTTKDFTSDNASEKQSFSLNVSAEASVGGSFAGIGASVSAGVSGDYSNSNLTSHTSSVSSTLALTVHLGSINQSLGEDQYTVTPYSYWSKDGALVIDYAVEPETAPPGDPETWWQQMYGHAPDPAFALPYLYWPREGFAVQDTEQLHETKEIFSEPSDPAPGDTVTTTVRIHNYSLVPTDTTVNVSFYIGNPANGGTVIKSLSGDSVFTTPDVIPARGSQIFSFKWVAPAAAEAQFIHSGEFIHVWGVIDPGSMTEIHKSNDAGWSTLEIQGILSGVESSNHPPSTFALSQNYPNPFNPTTVIKYTVPKTARVVVNVYDVLGRKVATLVDAVRNPGTYEVDFNGSRFASGVYFYRLVSGSYTSVRKMLLIK